MVKRSDLPPDIQRIWKGSLDAGVPPAVVLARAQELDRDAEATYQALLVAFAEKDALEAVYGKTTVDPFDPDQRRVLTGERGARMAKKRVVKKKVRAKKVTGEYSLTFTGCTDTIESIFGDKPISPSQVANKMWAYVKRNRLAFVMAGNPRTVQFVK
jgi:hypothetical protein